MCCYFRQNENKPSPNFSFRKITKTKESWFTDSDVETCGVRWQTPREGAELSPSVYSPDPPAPSPCAGASPLLQQEQSKIPVRDKRQHWHEGQQKDLIACRFLWRLVNPKHFPEENSWDLPSLRKIPFTHIWTHLARPFLLSLNK